MGAVLTADTTSAGGRLMMQPSALLIYLLAGTLCVMYTADTIIVSYNYKFHSDNPPSSKLLFLAEMFKFVTSASLLLLERSKSSRDGHADLQHGSKQQQPQLSLRCRLAAGARAMLVFAVPAVCYFLTNNLSFYALKIMSAHTYTLLSDLKVISTCVLSYLVLDKRLNQQAVVSLALLFIGICTGQYATLTAPEDAGTAGRPADNLLQGVLLMAVVAVLSAVAAVYTEWVMNYSASYKQESLHLQNMRLYASGTLLNGLYCLLSSSSTSLVAMNDMRPSHWANVVCLAFMGLATAVIIKKFGNIVKVYASCVASLFAAGISYSLLHDPPAPLFYAGCLLAMFATLQLQWARSAMALEAAGGLLGGGKGSSRSTAGLGWAARLRPWGSVAAVLVVLAVLCGLAPCNRQGMQSMQSIITAAVPGVRQAAFKPLGPTTDAPMKVLPPFEPTCFATDLAAMGTWGCPVIDCAHDASCTVHNTSCCAYLNYQMLTFFDEFMTSKCLQDEWYVMYGTAVGALRDKSIIPHTEDVDLGLTALAIQFLELNSTRQELWRYGYAFWYNAEKVPGLRGLRGWWKLCPHLHHPSPHFQAAMVQTAETFKAWERRTQRKAAAYIDFWPVWTVSDQVVSCKRGTDINLTATLATPWDEHLSAHPDAPFSPCSFMQAQRQQQRQHEGSMVAAGGLKKRCFHAGLRPLVTSPGTRAASIGDRQFPTADNQPQLLSSVYGRDWHKTDQRNHGTWVLTEDSAAVVQALLEKLSVGAWGNMTLSTRQQRCYAKSSALGRRRKP